MTKILQILPLVWGLMATSIVQGAEKKIARAGLPPAVEKTVAEQTKNAVIKGLSTEVDHGKRVYEAELVVDGHGRDVTIEESGTIIEIEDEVSLASLPPSVKDGLTKMAGPGSIAKVESLTKQGKLVAYEAVVRQGKKRHEIQVGPDGQALAHPE